MGSPEYPREGSGDSFDRVVFFSDAVIAIAVTLMAVDIGVPEVEDVDSVQALWEGLVAKGPNLIAYGVAFFWVAIYWRANHRFTATLRGMSSTYIGVTLLFLGFIAVLPVPAAVLGEYTSNPLAVALFALVVAILSSLEVVLMLVAYRDRLYLNQPSRAQLRYQVLGSLTPVPGFLISIPVAFWSPLAAMLCWFVCSFALGWLVSRADPDRGGGEAATA
ncbi:MAG: TMEM175 family protein [Candidatus Nanopelagicales bacterium]